MPIYDYDCTNCRHRVEVIHGIHDAGPRFCPSCGAEGTMRKALATPAIHFKGSGWAKKDRSSTSGTKAKAGHASTADGGSSGDAGKAASAAGDSSGTAGGSGTSSAAARSED